MDKLFQQGLKDIEELGIRLVQHEDEFFELFKLVHQLQPKTYVQIGSFQGACEVVLSHACAEGATIISVDNGTEGRKNEDRIPAIEKTHEYLQGKGFDMRLVIGDSSDVEIVESVHNSLGWEDADFVYIDGGHAFNQTIDDWKNYKGRLVAIHDINPNNNGRKGLCTCIRSMFLSLIILMIFAKTKGKRTKALREDRSRILSLRLT